MRKRVGTALAALGMVLVAVVLLWPTQPKFIYHTGIIAIGKNETVTLRIFFTNSTLRASNMAVTALIGDGCDSAEVVESAWSSRVGLKALGFVDLRVRLTGDGSKTINALRVRSHQGETVLPVGNVQLLSVPYDAENTITGLTRSTLVAEEPTEVSVSMPMISEVVVKSLFPDLGSTAQVAISHSGAGSLGSSRVSTLQMTLADDLWLSPSCLIYRPVLCATSIEVVEYSLGSLIQVLTGVRGG